MKYLHHLRYNEKMTANADVNGPGLLFPQWTGDIFAREPVWFSITWMSIVQRGGPGITYKGIPKYRNSCGDDRPATRHITWNLTTHLFLMVALVEKHGHRAPASNQLLFALHKAQAVYESHSLLATNCQLDELFSRDDTIDTGSNTTATFESRYADPVHLPPYPRG